jgi:hypothetical protein
MHKKPMKYGYAPVSTDGQSVEAQVRQLTKAGCRKMFRETASGVKTDRSQPRKALNQLGNDDVLVVTRLDRLARSTRDLLNTLATRPRCDRGERRGERNQLQPSCAIHLRCVCQKTLTLHAAWQEPPQL